MNNGHQFDVQYRVVLRPSNAVHDRWDLVEGSFFVIRYVLLIYRIIYHVQFYHVMRSNVIPWCQMFFGM